MRQQPLTISEILNLIRKGKKFPLATRNYPSRGQTTTQDLYQTPKGKFFLKKPSKRNHEECQINIKDGTLSEREYWAYRLATEIGLHVPTLWLVNRQTTVQVWLDYPDARTFATSQGKMTMKAENVFNCALFDWVTGQIDRHDANYLYNYVDKEIILIDSAFSFLKYSGSIPDYLKYFEIGFPDELKRRLKTTIQSQLSHLKSSSLVRLIPLKNKLEKEALQHRLEQIQTVQCIQDIIHLYRGTKK